MKPRVYGKVANFGRTMRGDELPPSGPSAWPPDIRDSETWFADGEEATLNVYWDRLKRCGLNMFSVRARPSHQDRRNRHDVHVIERWKVGVHLAFEAARDPGSVGPWYLGGKKVMDRLVALPRGKHRVQTAAALCSFLAMTAPSEELGDLPTQAHDFLRKVRW